jgi:hypothetical protein
MYIIVLFVELSVLYIPYEIGTFNIGLYFSQQIMHDVRVAGWHVHWHTKTTTLVYFGGPLNGKFGYMDVFLGQSVVLPFVMGCGPLV